MRRRFHPRLYAKNTPNDPSELRTATIAPHGNTGVGIGGVVEVMLVAEVVLVVEVVLVEVVMVGGVPPQLLAPPQMW